MNNDIQVADTPEKIEAFRLLALKGSLKLEVAGMHRHGRSAYSIVKEKFNLKGSKASVLAQFEAILRDRGILVEVKS